MGSRVTLYRETTSIPRKLRQPILRKADEITDLIWHKDANFYRNLEEEIFNDHMGLALAKDAGQIVGFSIFRRLRVADSLIIYSFSSSVMPTYQERGLRTELAHRIIAGESNKAGEARLYLAWRTRNPIAWLLLARMCKSVAPALNGGECPLTLIELGRYVANQLYPNLSLEIPSMVMRRSYLTTAYRVEPRHRDPAFDTAFYANLSNREDAIFSIGEILPDKRG